MSSIRGLSGRARPEPELEVSVVIATRDRWPLLRFTLAAALDQRDVHHEVIVVDDGSRDETAEQLAAIDDPRLVVLRHPRSEGVARARNLGIERARGAMVAFLDDDDLWAPFKLRAQLDSAEAVQADFVYCDFLLLDGDRKVVGVMSRPDADGLELELLRYNVIGSPSMVMARTELVQRIGGFDDSFSVLADWDMWIRLAATGRAARCPRVLAAYVEHAGGMLTRHPGRTTDEFERLALKHADATRQHGVELDRAKLELALARGHARGGRRLKAFAAAGAAAVRHRRLRHAVLALVLLSGGDALALRLRRGRRPVPEAPAWLSAFGRGGTGSGNGRAPVMGNVSQVEVQAPDRSDQLAL